jgi:hypothetical protein
LPLAGRQGARRAGSGIRQAGLAARLPPHAALQAGARDAERCTAGGNRAQFGQRRSERVG